MSDPTLMVIMDEEQWTRQALHLACAISRQQKYPVALIKLVPVQHPAHLGTGAGYVNLSANEAQSILEFAALAEEYGTTIDVKFCQYAAFHHAVVDVAAQVQATAVFINLNGGHRFPWWAQLRTWWLKRQLSRQGQQLFTLAPNSDMPDWTPVVTLAQ